MKKLFKSTVALFLGLCILCTSINIYELVNAFPSHENQVSPSSYDEVETDKDTIF